MGKEKFKAEEGTILKVMEATRDFWRQPLDIEKWEKIRGKIHIIPGRCKGCGFCIEFCPQQVLQVSSSFNEKGYHPPEVKPDSQIDRTSRRKFLTTSGCINCGLCELLCPEFAIFSTPEG